MSMADGVRKGVIAGLMAGLAITPVSLAKPLARAENFIVAAMQEPNAFADRESEQDRQDREQEKRDREQEARDREEEKKDREQERLDRLQELYDDGREALDEEKYQQADQKFNELVKMNGPQTDAALYWRAYAENRQGKRDTALATIAEVKRRFPQSRWKRDAEALEIEVRNRSGQSVKVDDASDDRARVPGAAGLGRREGSREVPGLLQTGARVMRASGSQADGSDTVSREP